MNDAEAPKRLISAASEKFGTERLDVLVNLVDVAGDKSSNLEALNRLSTAVVEVMGREGKGSIINVVGNGEDLKEGEERPAVCYHQC